MIYKNLFIGGELYHAGSHKYLDKIKTKSGKWRYIYTKPMDKKISLKEDAVEDVNKSVSTANAKSVGPRTTALLNKLSSFGSTNSSTKPISSSASSMSNGRYSSTSIKKAKEKVDAVTSKDAKEETKEAEKTEEKEGTSSSKGKSGGSSKSSGGKRGKSGRSSGSKKESSSKEKSEGKGSGSSKSEGKEKTSDSSSGTSLGETEQKIQKGMKKENDSYNEEKATLEKLYRVYKNQKSGMAGSKGKALFYKRKIENLTKEHQEKLAMYQQFLRFLKED